MFPDAPGLFSTITGWPSDCVSLSATARARMSVDPPGAQGTMMCTGRSGYAACARIAAREKNTALRRDRNMAASLRKAICPQINADKRGWNGDEFEWRATTQRRHFLAISYLRLSAFICGHIFVSLRKAFI